MSYLTTNRKKIRGWKNQVRKIQKWKDTFIDLDVESLKESKRAYVKIWIDPWYRFIRRNPPNWYNRLILEALIEIYLSWYDTLMRSGEPFYLKIWLYDPHFIKSQVVAAIGDEIDYYTNTFEKNDDIKEFPYAKYKIKSFDMHNFQWQLCIDEDFFFKRTDELTDQEIRMLEKKAYKIEKEVFADIDDICYRVKNGDVWIGNITK